MSELASPPPDFWDKLEFLDHQMREGAPMQTSAPLVRYTQDAWATPSEEGGAAWTGLEERFPLLPLKERLGRLSIFDKVGEDDTEERFQVQEYLYRVGVRFITPKTIIKQTFEPVRSILAGTITGYEPEMSDFKKLRRPRKYGLGAPDYQLVLDRMEEGATRPHRAIKLLTGKGFPKD
jgi:hypothetical protein